MAIAKKEGSEWALSLSLLTTYVLDKFQGSSNDSPG